MYVCLCASERARLLSKMKGGAREGSVSVNASSVTMMVEELDWMGGWVDGNVGVRLTSLTAPTALSWKRAWEALATKQHAGAWWSMGVS